jgi:hypothetical protein
MARYTVTEAIFLRIVEAAGLDPDIVSDVSIMRDEKGTRVSFVVFPNERMTELLDLRSG